MKIFIMQVIKVEETENALEVEKHGLQTQHKMSI